MTRSKPPAHRHDAAQFALRVGVGLLLGGASWVVLAQGTGSRTLTITPSAQVTETLTDNLRLQDSNKLTDAVTQLTASLRVDSRSGRLQGSLDYALSGFAYARGNGASSIQNNLKGQFRAEVVDNWFTIDGSAQIGQQAISAFGVQSMDRGLPNANQSEVRTFQITPAVNGKLGAMADYQASLTQAMTRTDANNERGNVDTTTASVAVSSPKGTVLGWQAGYTRSRTDYVANRATDSDTATLGLSYAVLSDLMLKGNVGRESNNYSTLDMKAYSNWGAGADWAPSSNLRVSGQLDHRFFGNGHRLSVDYRLPRSSLRLSSSRDVTNPNAQSVLGAFATAYDLFYSQFAGMAPDPVKRDELVRSYLNFYGISPSAQVATGFLPSAATLQRRTELSYAMQGVRSNLVLTLSNLVSSRLDILGSGVDDLSSANLVRQRNISLTLGHRLTPNTGLSLELLRNNTSGDTAAQATSLKSMRLSLTTTLGQRSTATLSARHVIFDSLTQPYTENALVASFGLQF